MTLNEVMTHFGASNHLHLSKLLDLTPAAIHYWKTTGIPYREQCVLEVETGGALKAKGARKYVQDLQ